MRYNNFMNIFDFLDKLNIPYSNTNLIKQAFIHSSYINEHKSELGDNERLEFVGDAVLQIYSAHRLYEIKPELSEGHMSTRRSNLVSEKALAEIVRENGLNEFLMLGAGEEKTGGRNRDSIIADMFEAFTGAIYLDSGYDVAFDFLDKMMLKHIRQIDESVYDYKTKLQEYIQADSKRVIKYETVKTNGPSNNPIFEVVVKIDNLIYGRGKGTSKKEAQKNAAKDALGKIAKL